MSKEQLLNIMLADDDEDDRNFFNDAIKELKMKNNLTVFKDGKDLMDYLNSPNTVLPHILFLDLNMPCKSGNDCLEDTFIDGANIYIKKPNDFTKLKKILHEVVNLNWQFHTSGLNKDTFFFSI